MDSSGSDLARCATHANLLVTLGTSSCQSTGHGGRVDPAFQLRWMSQGLLMRLNPILRAVVYSEKV